MSRRCFFTSSLSFNQKPKRVPLPPGFSPISKVFHSSTTTTTSPPPPSPPAVHTSLAPSSSDFSLLSPTAPHLLMEERDHPSSSTVAISHELPVPDPDPDPNPDPDPLRPNEPHEVFPMGTYVVQVPKDQVYRVPPPENALIIERYRTPIAKSKGPWRCCCCLRLLFIFIAVLTALGVLLSITSTIIKAKDPVFYIDHFLIKNKSRSSQGNVGHEFDIRTRAKNPNVRSAILYKEGGKSSLSFEKKEVAIGKFPTFYQSKKSTTTSQLVLHDSSNGSSKGIDERMKGAKSKPNLSFALSIKVPARMTVGLFKKQDVNIVVSCNFEVDTLAEGRTRVHSQQCRTEH
ncbi:NDR1/HIN1-like protein 13 [Rhodamnia argentea]|uniref:NDR1/HIN1-like protein 13 n=1 Tax=Rhodamnia argentea TaxID=178133 RepID=A0ABM3H2U7_9MYRT|nr:NDR1/HIN1-like protein 13 [Rhodamnia argentea]